jgi:tetratricopeptide (TPR) repeat protein
LVLEVMYRPVRRLVLVLRLWSVYAELASARVIHSEGLMTIDLITIAELKGDLGQWQESESFANQARQLATARHDTYRSAQANFHLGRAQLELGKFSAAESSLTAALADLRSSRDSKHRAYVLLLLGRALDKQDRHGQALATFENVLTLAEDTGDKRTAALALVQLGNANHWAGAFDAAEGYFRRALAQYEALGDGQRQREVKLALGYVAFRMGRFTEAHQLAVETYDYFRRTGRTQLATSAQELLWRLDHPGHATGQSV